MSAGHPFASGVQLVFGGLLAVERLVVSLSHCLSANEGFVTAQSSFISGSDCSQEGPAQLVRNLFTSHTFIPPTVPITTRINPSGRSTAHVSVEIRLGIFARAHAQSRNHSVLDKCPREYACEIRPHFSWLAQGNSLC